MTISVPDGGFFDFGDKIPYTVTVTDPEDTTIDCSKVTVQTQLGHDSHAHPLDVYTGCSGLLATEADAGDGHGPGQNLYTLITAQYTDGGAAGGVPALTGSTRVAVAAQEQGGRALHAPSPASRSTTGPPPAPASGSARSTTTTGSRSGRWTCATSAR